MSESTIRRSSTRKPAPEIPHSEPRENMTISSVTSESNGHPLAAHFVQNKQVNMDDETVVPAAGTRADNLITTPGTEDENRQYQYPLLIKEASRFIHARSSSDAASFSSPRSNCYCPRSPTMEFRIKKIPVSINVPISCRRLVELYGRLEQHRDYLGPVKRGINEAIQELALYRYESLWLPLAAEYKLYSGAPADVQAIWLAHMMDPLAYRQDCQRVAGKLIEHRLVSRRKLRQLTSKARGLWSLRYPKEPFDFDPNRTGYGHVLETQHSGYGYGHSNRISGEVLTIARCHSHFFYQVSLPHYTQVNFLEQSEHRYKQFLHVRKVQYQIAHYLLPQPGDKKVNGHWTRTPDHGSLPSPRQASLPSVNQYVPIDIELAWRAHMVHPKSYARDTSCLFGKLLPHPCRPHLNTMLTYLNDMQAPWSAPRTLSTDDYHSDTEPLFNASLHHLWNAHFPTNELYRAGSQDRGLPPHDQIRSMEATEMYAIATKCAHMSINAVIARFDPHLEKYTIRIRQQPTQAQRQPRPQADRLEQSPTTTTPTTTTLLPVSQPSIHQTQFDWESPTQQQQQQPSHSLLDDCICKLHSPRRIWTATDALRPIARFTMISGVHDQLAIDLIDKRGWLCPSNTLLGRGLLQLTSTIEQFPMTAPMEFEFTCPLHMEISGEYQRPSSVKNGSTNKPLHQNSSENQRETLAKPSVTLLLSVAPPMRHAFRLKVKVGPAFVCRLPAPSAHVNSVGYRIWGPVTHSPRPDSVRPFGHTKENINHGGISPNGVLTTGFPFGGLDESRSLVVVSHILNHLGEHVLTVRVLHNVARRLAVVQVWRKDRLLSVGQLIGRDQLPECQTKMKFRPAKQSTLQRLRERTQFTHSLIMNGRATQNRVKNSADYSPQYDTQSENSDSLPVNSLDDLNSDTKSTEHCPGWGLNEQQNERAILIKDARGDWCLLIGRWSGFKRCPDPLWSSGYPVEDEINGSSIGVGGGGDGGGDGGDGGACSTRGRGGHLSLRIRWLSLPEPKHAFAQIPDNVNSLSVILQQAAINIQTGEIQISKHCQEIAQNVCLAFCCGLMQVLCQPRVLTQELGTKSIWDMSPSDVHANGSFQPTQSQSIGSIQDVDTDQPSVLTASTSFDSNNHMSVGEPNLTTDTGGTRAHCAAVRKQMQWSVDPVVPKEWDFEKNRILQDGSPNQDDDERPFTQDSCPTPNVSQVEIVGVARLLEAPNKVVKNCSTDLLNRSTSSKSTSMYRTLDTQSSTIGSTRFRNRGPLGSLSFALCRAVGLPIDSLIASVQLIRYVDRTTQLNSYISGTLLVTSPESSRPESSKTTSGESNGTTANCSNGLRTGENGCPVITDVYRSRSTDIPWQDSFTWSRLLAEWPKLRHPFLGWKLCDFYDYFLLELPDICSGCVAGCRYCSGFGYL